MDFCYDKTVENGPYNVRTWSNAIFLNKQEHLCVTKKIGLLILINY